MTYLEMNFRSHALNMNVPVTVILPEVGTTGPVGGAPEGTYKTLYLLHGLCGNHTDWSRKTSIERYASDHGIAVVMPAVARSWYTDTVYGANYFTFVTQELPHVCRSYFKGMSDRREDNLIGGLSMGGYGAIKAALTYPEQYSACVILSSALDITRKGRNYSLPEWQSIFDYEMKDALELEGSCHDVYALARKNAAEKKPFPKLYMWCGTEDTLITPNREFHGLLEQLGVPHCYEESTGTHNWKYWDPMIQRGLQNIFEQK